MLYVHVLIRATKGINNPPSFCSYECAGFHVIWKAKQSQLWLPFGWMNYQGLYTRLGSKAMGGKAMVIHAPILATKVHGCIQVSLQIKLSWKGTLFYSLR